MMVSTPSRLHFGMFSFGRPEVRQYGGVGVMIDRPQLVIRFSPSEQLAVGERMHERVQMFVDRATEFLGLDHPPDCRIEVLEAPPEHVGLGVGTQLALAVATGLARLVGRSDMDERHLAMATGRAERSAIGTYGFCKGGLLIENGKQPSEVIAPLQQRVEMPAEWRFVLIRPASGHGLSGGEEHQAFTDLPPVPEETTARLRTEALEHLAPAAAAADFDAFSASLYRYGYTAGICFATAQGGPFAGTDLQQLVETVRALGVRGVGQSSWGPTLFALVRDDQHAQHLSKQLQSDASGSELSITIAGPDNHGVRIDDEVAS
jgi:beta-ribofuranosylaminobenzene 5'-phosphate synthase